MRLKKKEVEIDLRDRGLDWSLIYYNGKFYDRCSSKGCLEAPQSISGRHCPRETKKEFGLIGGLCNRHHQQTEGGCVCRRIDGEVLHPATQEYLNKRTPAEILIRLKLPNLDILDPNNTNLMPEHRLTLMREHQEEIINTMEKEKMKNLRMHNSLSSLRTKVNRNYDDQMIINKKRIWSVYSM